MRAKHARNTILAQISENRQCSTIILSRESTTVAAGTNSEHFSQLPVDTQGASVANLSLSTAKVLIHNLNR